MKVWVLRYETTDNYTEITLYSTKEKAQKHLEEIKKDFIVNDRLAKLPDVKIDNEECRFYARRTLPFAEPDFLEVTIEEQEVM